MRLVNDKVLGHMGDVLAEKIRGEWHTKDAVILQFISDQEEVVRARNEDGHFIADDPATPDVNEAWVVKTVKKAVKNK
jgi:hypothetical protein